jgi:FkbH-like protein
MNQEAEPEVIRTEALSLGLLADFNVQNLAVLLRKNTQRYEVSCVQAPFGQTVNVLLDPKGDFWSVPYDAVVLWTLPERAVPSFGRVLSFEQYLLEELLKEVDSFAELVERIPARVRAILIPSWIAPGMERGWGPLDLVNGFGIANALMRMNLRLADRLGQNRGVVLLDSYRWMSTAGAGAYNPKLWYLSKTPFHSTVFQEASKDILATLDGIRGHSKKIVILDLDNMLWGGVVGDVGWEKLRLGGHDPIGEAFVDFQKTLKCLINRGVVLAIVSKNEELVALEAIRQHPEMVLRTDDFAGWRINWADKAQNIVDLVSELNLGLESAVFLDDSAFERARVREALPQLLVPEMPEDPSQYSLFLSRFRCFDIPAVSAEDRSRTKMYVADRGRTALRKDITSLEKWLETLDLNISVERLNHKNLARAAQLFNKTNQMNLSTRRLAAGDLLNWAEADGHTVWTFRVWDKFGDYGLCGICSFVQSGATGHMVDFLLSCRVMGRGVEEAMLATVTQHAKDSGCDVLSAEYIPSAKNQPCRRWLQRLPFVEKQENRFIFSPKSLLAFPRHIRISFC